MQISHFIGNILKKPEFRLASRISGIVLILLLCVVALSVVFAETADHSRRGNFFQMRENALLRRPQILQNLSSLPQRDLSERIKWDRRSLPPNLRNLAIVFPSGEVEILWSLEEIAPRASFFTFPERTIETREIWGESYVFYTFPVGDRRVILYEPSEILEGPRGEVIGSLILGIVLFSILLFFVALDIAKKVIQPIERLAEREKAYARHIAHELKTPLAVAKSDLEIALILPKEWKSRVTSAIGEIDSMRSSIDNLLLLSMSSSWISQKKIDLRKVIEGVIAVISKTESEISWKIIPEKSGTCFISADPRLLEPFLRNLCENVRIHATPQSIAEIYISQQELIISNESPKVSADIAKRAFEPFIGTPGKGSGIGLSLVKRIADLHGWEMSFEVSEDGKRVRIRTVFGLWKPEVSDTI